MLAALAALAAIAAWRALGQGGPAPVLPAPCRLDVALAVPRLEAAPILLAGPVRRPRATACRLRLVTGAKARGASLALVAGDAWAGERPSPLLPFLLIAQRAGALLVSRTPVAPHFLWHGTAERVLLLPAGSGDLGSTVVRAMLSLHAVKGAAVLRGLGTAAFAAGSGDYLELPLWSAEEVLARGGAHFATDLAIQGGPLPAAVLAASPALAGRDPALLDAVAAAVAAAVVELHDHPEAMAARWPGRLPRAARRTLARALSRARYEHLWATDPRLDRSLFVRLDVLRRAAGESAFTPPVILAGPAESALRRLALPHTAG